jgi:hypothetical protein
MFIIWLAQTVGPAYLLTYVIDIVNVSGNFLFTAMLRCAVRNAIRT